MKRNLHRGVLLILCLALAGSAVLAACSARGASPKTAPASADYAMDAGGVNGVAEEAPMNTMADAGEAGNGSLGAAARPTDGEKLIENLYYQIETLQFDDSVQKARSLYESLGGYVQESSVEGLSGRSLRFAHYVLRIPQDKTSQMKERAGELGNVLRTETSVQNVTDEYYDIEARLKSLRAQEERLLELLEKSGTLEDIVQLEQALSDVTYEIEKLTGALRNYDSLIEYITVTIDLQEVTKETQVEQAPVTLGERISAQFNATMRGLGSFGEESVVFLVGSLPVLLLLGVLALLVLWIVRMAARAGKKRAQKRAARQAEAPFENPQEHTDDKPE